MTKAEIQFVKSLSDKKVRQVEGVFVAEGEKLVAEVVASGFKVQALYQTEELFAEGVMISHSEMGRISTLKTPTKALAVVRIPQYDLKQADAGKNLVLALDCVQNPGNFGTIIRLADWFGISDIVCSEDTADCFNAKVVQATMGAILRVRVHYCSLDQWLQRQCEAGCNVYGTFLEGDDIYRTQLCECGVILMGNEGKGVSPECAQSVTRKLLIPPYPTTRRGSESLNVAIATAIICSEFRRR